MAILTRNTAARTPGVISDFRAMFNANPGLEGRIKRAPHGHYVSAMYRRLGRRLKCSCGVIINTYV